MAMKVAISTASSYSETLRLSLHMVGERAEVLNSWGNREGLKKLIDGKQRWNTLLLQWPEALLKPEERVSINHRIIKEVADLLGRVTKYTKVIFTFHNLLPHEHLSELEKELYKVALEVSSVILHHSSSGYDRAVEMYPVLREKANVIFRHPPYFFVRRCRFDEAFIKAVNLFSNRYYFLIIGSIVPYKNIELFLNSLAGFDPSRYGLIIAGNGRLPYVQELMIKMRPLLRKGFDIKLIIKWLSEQEISTLVRRGDFLVCNNSEDSLTSGIPHLCEAGPTLLYSDVEHHYFSEIFPKCVLCKKELENIAIKQQILKNLQLFYDQNNPFFVGTTLKQIIQKMGSKP